MATAPKSWAETFAAQLKVDGERVPFERVLARHLDEISRMRSTSGLTWRSLASLLIRAGARRADGNPISADQLRVGYARLVSHAAKGAANLPPTITSQIIRQRGSANPQSAPVAELPMSPPPPAAIPTAADKILPKPQSPSIADEDVSDHEIALALARLTKLSEKS